MMYIKQKETQELREANEVDCVDQSGSDKSGSAVSGSLG